jgi:hypothetical protein
MGILAKLALIDWMAILCLVALAALAGAAEAGILGDHKRTAGFAMLGLVVVIVAVFATSRLEDSLLFGNPEQAKEDPRGKKKGDYGNVDIKKNGGAGGGAAAGDGSGPGDGSGGAEHKAGEGQGKPGANADAATAAGDGKSKDDEKNEEDICGDGTGGKVKASNKKANAQAALPSVRAGSSQHDCPHCPRLAYVPRGCFDMGSPASQDGFRQEEGPQTRIKIGRAFYIGRY